MKGKSFSLFILVVALGFFLTGCGCFQQAMKGEAPPPKAPEAKVVAPEAKKAIPVAPAPAAEAPKAVPAVSLNDIFFDFDKYNVRSGDAEILKKNADWFAVNKGKKVKVEGHCDERGTTEYNLALGQKRADATKKYLAGIGVDEKALETVSYGEERPFDSGHNEAAWAKNRRAHFVPAK